MLRSSVTVLYFVLNTVQFKYSVTDIEPKLTGSHHRHAGLLRYLFTPQQIVCSRRCHVACYTSRQLDICTFADTEMEQNKKKHCHDCHYTTIAGYTPYYSET